MKRLLQTAVLLCWVATNASAQSAPQEPTGDAATAIDPSEAAPPPEPANVSDSAPVAESAPTATTPPAPATSSVAAEPSDAPTPTSTAETSWTETFAQKLQVHGFVSEGGFLSTANQYIGASSRGSLKFHEVGINLSVELTEQLRVGVQFVSRNVGTLSEDGPRLDWGLVDYRFARWLGLRAGRIKMPLGLYNEYVDIDAGRTAILLPQSMYPVRNRDALIAHTGFAAYGIVPVGLGEIEYQAWLGTLTIPRSALVLSGGSLDSVDTKYVTGAQIFWRPPIEGLRIGATYMRASIDFNITLDSTVVDQLVMAGLVDPAFDGGLVISQRPTGFWVASAEYIYDDWMFSAEYSRWLKHQQSTLPAILATFDEDSERFYVMVTHRFSSVFELATYYSVLHADADDRTGRGADFDPKFRAFQRDLALSARFDVNPYWLWKIEGHLIDGTADLDATRNPDPQRTWGLFLIRTTVTF